MKKLIVFLLIIATLFSTLAFKTDKNVLISIDGLEKVCFVAGFKIEEEGFESVESGDLFFNYCASNLAESAYKKYQSKSQSVQYYYVGIEAEKIIDELKADIVEQSQIEGIEIYYGYSPYLTNAYLVDGKKLNLQLAVTQEYVIAGYPIILTGY